MMSDVRRDDHTYKMFYQTKWFNIHIKLSGPVYELSTSFSYARKVLNNIVENLVQMIFPLSSYKHHCNLLLAYSQISHVEFERR